MLANIHFTASCRFTNFQARTLFAMVVAAQVYRECGVSELWITSVDDKGHMRGSKHYTGDAFDCRVRNIPASQRKQVPVELRKRLSPCWDVLDEGDHIHVEYDPR